MPAYNPFLGGVAIPMTQAPNGANPAVDLSPPILVGAKAQGGSASNCHLGVAGILTIAILLIAGIHFAGFRTQFTIGAGD